MCEGIVVDRAPRERINPPPEIGDIWRIDFENSPSSYVLILDIDEGEGYRNATILNLENGGVISNFLDTFAMMQEICWTKVA